ncbi:MAG: hypothetical protein GX146_12650 [Myxococcales bacterium]|nr:hypothetical protein [Myxococcales bacterium]
MHRRLSTSVAAPARLGLCALLCLTASACLTRGPQDGASPATASATPQCTAPDLWQPAVADYDDADDASAAPARRSGSATIALTSEPDTLLPLYTQHRATASIIAHEVVEPLVVADAFTGALSPGLANAWHTEDDGLNWTLTLVPNALWHDQTPFTARDVAFTFAQILDPQGGTVVARSFADVAEVSAADDTTVHITLDAPSDTLPARLSRVFPVPEHVFAGSTIPAHPAARAPLGTGPFRFHHWSRGKHLELRRSSTWREAPAGLQRLEYRFVADTARALRLLSRGEVDIVSGAHAAAHEPMTGERLAPSTHTTAIVYNPRVPALRDADTRRALDRLIDRDTLRHALFRCRELLVTAPWMSVPRAPAAPVFSIERARTHLQKAGWALQEDGSLWRDGAPLRFDLLVPKLNRTHSRVVHLLQRDLHKAGIRMGLVEVGDNLFQQRLHAQRYDAAWVSIDSAEPFDSGNLPLPYIDVHAPRDTLAQHCDDARPLSFISRPLRSFVARSDIAGIRLRADELDERHLYRVGSERSPRAAHRGGHP